jgi:hypothetical protein
VLDREAILGDVLAWLLKSGAPVRAVTPQRSSLETLFMAAAAESPGGATSESERRSA